MDRKNVVDESDRTRRDASDDLSRRINYLCERNLGDMLRMEGNAEEALQCLVRAAELDARDVVLWEEIDDWHALNRKMKLARHAFREGLRRSPNHWGCLSQLATVQIVLNRKDEASKTISQMTKLRTPSSLSLASLRKRRLAHVDNMQVRKRCRNFDNVEDNVLCLSECNVNALGSLLLNALRSSDENRNVSVQFVPASSSSSSSSSHPKTNQTKGGDDSILSREMRKQMLDLHLQRLDHERNTGLKSSSSYERISKTTSSSIQIHGYSVEDLTGDALLGRDVCVVDSSSGSRNSGTAYKKWRNGIVFSYNRETKTHLIVTSKGETKFTTLDASNYQKLWRFTLTYHLRMMRKKRRKLRRLHVKKIKVRKRKAKLVRGVIPPPQTRIAYQDENPKKKKSKSHARYETYKKAKTLEEFYSLGGKKADYHYDLKRGYLKLLNDDGEVMVLSDDEEEDVIVVQEDKKDVEEEKKDENEDKNKKRRSRRTETLRRQQSVEEFKRF